MTDLKPYRKIHLVGAISQTSYRRFAKLMTKYERSNNYLPIEIELTSDGGDTYAALAFAARIRRSPCHTTIRAYGRVASAAVIILAYGGKRLMTKEAWVMVHEDSDDAEGSVTSRKEHYEHAERLEMQWSQLLAEKTTASAQLWRDLHGTCDRYLDAEECLKLGLIDEVV